MSLNCRNREIGYYMIVYLLDNLNMIDKVSKTSAEYYSYFGKSSNLFTNIISCFFYFLQIRFFHLFSI